MSSPVEKANDEDSPRATSSYSSTSVLIAAPPPQTPAPAGRIVESDHLCVVLYPPDEDVWLKLTWLLSFTASFVFDGVCLSLTLLDARIGMTELVPPGTRTLEHVATVLLFRHLIEPFSCAYVNRYGFRYCLFVGSLLSITWIILLLRSTGNAFLFEYCLVSAIIGGIGMGAIKTSFSVLLSSLFLVNRQRAHLSRHLGSFTGMMLIPPVTEFVLLTSHDWQSALHLHLILMCSSLAFWSFIVTPVPLKIEDVDEGPPPSAADVSTTVRSAAENSQYPTIRDTVANKKLEMVPFTENTAVAVLDRSATRSSRPAVQGVHNMNTFYVSNMQKKKTKCMRNLTNMFENRILGSRPMYRDDILYNGDIKFLLFGLKSNKYFEYLMATTRVFTTADLYEEKYTRCKISCPIAMNRVLDLMYDMSIWDDEQFVLMLATEALIYASRFLPFVFIKSPQGLNSSAEAMITLIAGCLGSLFGRSIGYLLHETSYSSGPVPLYHVSLVLIANGLSLFLCTTGDIVTMLPYFGLFGFLFGYYASLKNAVVYSMFPLQKLNNARGLVSVIRALSSFSGILIAITILHCYQLAAPACNGNVYIFAGILMTSGGVSVGLLRRDMTTVAAVVRPSDHGHFGPSPVQMA